MRGLERYRFKKERMPAWADQAAIRRIYSVSKEWGPEWHVDHIVPLCHPHVCGLHCEDNLQLLHYIPNIAKGNHYWPDMWPTQLPLLPDDTDPVKW